MAIMEGVSVQRFGLRCLILAGILAFFALAVLFACNDAALTKANVELLNIPLNLGGWKGQDLLITAEAKDASQEGSALSRQYTKDGLTISLSIIYYKDRRRGLYLPENYFSSEHSFIVNEKKERLASDGANDFYAKKLIVIGDKGNQVVLYYFESDGVRTSSYPEMRWQMMLNKIKAKTVGGVLVRVSTPIFDSPDKSLKVLKQFIREASPLISKYL
jgi:EpsI family protein